MESYNDVYSLGFERVDFISAQHGDNMHAVWEIIDNFITDEKVENFKTKTKERRQKVEHFKMKFMQECKNLTMKNKRMKLDLEEIQNSFEYLNRDMHLHSDLDNDEIPIENIILSPKVDDLSSITYYNKYKNLPLKVALFGKTNSGKSTLFNQILKREASIVHHIPHTTKDPIVAKLNYKGKRLEIIDTAGLDKSLIVEEKNPDFNVYYRNLEYLKLAQLHIVVVDALSAFRVKDIDMIRLSLKEGRGTILLVNKWDLIDEKWHLKATNYMKKQIEMMFSGENGCPLIFGSAMTGKGVENILDLIAALRYHV